MEFPRARSSAACVLGSKKRASPIASSGWPICGAKLIAGCTRSGACPSVDHGGFRLYETQAILRYVDALFPKPALQPTEPKAIARMNQIIGINDWYLFPQAARIIVFNRIIGPALLGIRPDETAIAAAVPDARLCLGELDRLLDDQPFLAGDQLTIADLMLAPQLYYLAATPEGAAILKDTALLSWLGRMNARPSMMATLPPEALRKAA